MKLQCQGREDLKTILYLAMIGNHGTHPIYEYFYMLMEAIDREETFKYRSNQVTSKV